MHRSSSFNRSLGDGDCFHVDGAVRPRMALSRMPGVLTQPLVITDPRKPTGVGWTVQQQVSVVGAGRSS
jgi:hypothetical protein